MNRAAMLLDLYQGRQDAYGGDEGRAIYQPVTEQLVNQHLLGLTPIGIYCCRHLNTNMEWYGSVQTTDDERRLNMVVKHGICDIDTGTWNEAYMLAKVLEGMKLRPWVERSRSKGWHVVVFSDDWVPAFIMRRCLKMAYQAIDLQAKEANPKSELLRPNQLGNYVRTPYKGAISTTASPGTTGDTTCLQGTSQFVSRQTMMDYTKATDGDPILLEDFLLHHALGLVESDNRIIRRWASKWFEPPRRFTINEGTLADDTELQQLVQRLSKPLRKLWTDGPQSGDTSQGLMALAWNVAKAGWQPSDVFKLVAAADLRWGKYHQRNDFEVYIADLVDRAYK